MTATAAEEHRVLQRERHQADDPAGAFGVEGDVLAVDLAEQLHPAAEDDPDRAGLVALPDHQLIGLIGLAFRVVEQAVELVDHRRLDLVVGHPVVAPITELWTSVIREDRRSRLSLAVVKAAGQRPQVEQVVEFVDQVRRGVDDVVGELGAQQLAQAFRIEVRVEAGLQRAALEQVVDGAAAVDHVEQDLAGAPQQRLLRICGSTSRPPCVASRSPQKTSARSSPASRISRARSSSARPSSKCSKVNTSPGDSRNSALEAPDDSGVAVAAEDVAGHGGSVTG